MRSAIRWLPVAWVLITLSLVAPQGALALFGSQVPGFLVAGVVGLAVLGLLGIWLLRHAPTRDRAWVGLGLVAAMAALTTALGSETFQLAISLAQGKALDGVTMAEALAHGERGIWVRLTDARVRSEDTHRLRFARGNPRGPGGETYSTIAVAPVSLAAEVTHEWPTLRTKLTGPQALWACSDSEGWTSSWDSERQAVRGILMPMAREVRASLDTELNPSATQAPGAGAIPAAPGAFVASRAPSLARLSVTEDARCIQLDQHLDASSAASDASTLSLALLSVLPLLALAMLAAAMAKPAKKRA